ncbi:MULTISPECIES: cupin domain-containing protein [unclassified Streptomyces]|uniref:cupin domain-containing protein n=1 Tax=unclassified Streptomyces TaxID=2593676 RepID=UPI0020339F60|nr:cupin domain-containing protein [Streptomyces sp. RKAG290]MCM2414764.1 cupin domain-containing protein [Streptomyces sp. RKAG290]
MRTGRQQGWPGRWGQRGRLVKVLVIGGCVAGLGFVPSAAVATPGSGVSGTVVAQGTSPGKLKVKAPKGRTDVTFRTITVEPGGSTGWHTHRGQLIVVVKSGTLTRTLDDCSVEVTPAGTSFIEPSGTKHRHIGRNLGTEPVVLWVTYLLPQGSELSYDADAVDCGKKK